MHAFQGRTVDHVIAAMEANPPTSPRRSPSTSRSRARHRAALVTDDREVLKERLDAATGERISALEAVAPDRGRQRSRSAGRSGRRPAIRDHLPARDGNPRRTGPPSPGASSPSARCRRGGFKSRIEISHLGRMLLREAGIVLPF